jgi:hypothetical protein
MMANSMCRACFELDQHDITFWGKRSVDTKYICHFLHPEKVNEWQPHDASNAYWKDYENLQDDGMTRSKNSSLNMFIYF